MELVGRCICFSCTVFLLSVLIVYLVLIFSFTMSAGYQRQAAAVAARRIMDRETLKEARFHKQRFGRTPSGVDVDAEIM